MHNIVIIQLGKLYEKYRQAIALEELKGNVKVNAIGVPNPYLSSVDGWPMMSIQEAIQTDFDYLILSQSLQETMQTAQPFVKMGVHPDKILSIEVFGAICFNFPEYVRLCQNRVSIIAGNCWGGFTSHALKLPFLSPFVNLFLLDEDYLKLLSDLKGYLAKPLTQDMTERTKEYNYPIGLLGDVTLHLNHYPDFETAKLKWEERLQRINWQNLFIMMYTCDESAANRFARLPYQHKVVFTPADYGLDCQINLSCFQDLINHDVTQFFKSVNSVATGTLQLYDPIRLLNGEKDFLRNRALDKSEMMDEQAVAKRVSILIPCRNSGRWLDRCVQSFLDQTLDPSLIEMVMVDDCSEDDTWEIMCRIERTYPDLVTIIKSDEFIGPGGARNLALSYATAPYVAMVDSDDWVEADYLEKMLDAAIKCDCDLVCCNAFRDFGDGRRFPLEYHQQNLLYEVGDLEARKRLLLQGNIKGRMMAKREYLLENEIFYPAGIVYEDICWNALNYCHIGRLCVIAECLYHYFVNPESVVLKKKQDYSHDMFTTNYIKWNEIVARGFANTMYREFELDMLVSYYLHIMKLYKMHFDTIPLEGFREMQGFLLEHFAEYRQNPYLDGFLSPGQKQLLEFIDQPMGEEELKALHNAILGLEDL